MRKGVRTPLPPCLHLSTATTIRCQPQRHQPLRIRIKLSTTAAGPSYLSLHLATLMSNDNRLVGSMHRGCGRRRHHYSRRMALHQHVYSRWPLRAKWTTPEYMQPRKQQWPATSKHQGPAPPPPSLPLAPLVCCCKRKANAPAIPSVPLYDSVHGSVPSSAQRGGGGSKPAPLRAVATVF